VKIAAAAEATSETKTGETILTAQLWQSDDASPGI
jgi:hypothetical protein